MTVAPHLRSFPSRRLRSTDEAITRGPLKIDTALKADALHPAAYSQATAAAVHNKRVQQHIYERSVDIFPCTEVFAPALESCCCPHEPRVRRPPIRTHLQHILPPPSSLRPSPHTQHHLIPSLAPHLLSFLSFHNHVCHLPGTEAPSAFGRVRRTPRTR